MWIIASNLDVSSKIRSRRQRFCTSVSAIRADGGHSYVGCVFKFSNFKLGRLRTTIILSSVSRQCGSLVVHWECEDRKVSIPSSDNPRGQCYGTSLWVELLTSSQFFGPYVHVYFQRVSSPSSVCLATHLTRAAASAASLRRPQISTRDDPPRALPEISSDNFPIISKDERKVAIGWDTRTWSRLCVVSFFHSVWLWPRPI